MDYYSKLMATCSSDATVRVFDVAAHAANPTGAQPLAELRGHDGPVWQISWAHPKFGVLLASCSYDRTVVIWQQDERMQWKQVHKYTKHSSSVNAVKWAPHECGLHLAAASSDGSVSILSFRDGAGWPAAEPFEVSNMGCNAVDWAPHAHLGSVDGGSTVARLVTASCDNKIKVWKATNINDSSQAPTFTLDCELPGGHEDWVRDVAWAPPIVPGMDVVASCSEDGAVIVWTRKEDGSKVWEPSLLNNFGEPVWRLSWSVTGSILAVSSGDSTVTLWKAGLDDKYKQVSQVEDVAGSVQQ